MRSDIHIILKGFGRFLFLSALVSLPVLTVSYDLIYLHNGLSENSLTEYFQETILLLTTLSFAYITIKEPSTRHFCALVTGFFACMLIREFDELLDLIVHGFWIYPALLVAAVSIAYASKNTKQALHTFAHFTQSRHFLSLSLGMALLLVFSRLFGMGSFWQGILGHGYDRLTKLVAEESLEVLGYTVIFYSAVGYFQSFLTWCKYRLEGEDYSDYIDKSNQFFTERLNK